MTSEPAIRVEIDTAIGAAYVQLSEKSVARTEEFSEDINVDLDDLGMVVGIELLDTSVRIPLDDLTARYHVKASTFQRLVASLQPTTSATVSTSSTPRRGSSLPYRTIEPREVNSA